VDLFSNVFFVSAMSVMLYLGGWHAPFSGSLPILDHLAGPFTAPLWFLAKSLLVSFVVFWVWITMPRVRVDQYLSVAWKVMLPLSIVNFVLTAVLIKAGVL
jgi:NADH-quinone oxidoreductase subunit H